MEDIANQTTDQPKVKVKPARLNDKLEKAAILVEHGEPLTKAMEKAGYAQSTVKKGIRAQNKTIQARLLGSQNKYLAQFSKELIKKGLNADTITQRLADIVGRKDDFNAISAIREIHRVILRNSERIGNITVEKGVFVIPPTISEKDWENSVDRENV